MQVHLIDINVSAEIDEYPSLRFQDIRKNQSVTDGHTDGRENSIPHNKQSLWGGIISTLKEINKYHAWHTNCYLLHL